MTYGRPYGMMYATAGAQAEGLYAALMRGVRVVTTGIQNARDKLRQYVDAAAGEGQHTVIERHGRPVAVLVPVAWYIGKGGDPREPLSEIAEGK